MPTGTLGGRSFLPCCFGRWTADHPLQGPSGCLGCSAGLIGTEGLLALMPLHSAQPPTLTGGQPSPRHPLCPPALHLLQGLSEPCDHPGQAPGIAGGFCDLMKGPPSPTQEGGSFVGVPPKGLGTPMNKKASVSTRPPVMGEGG